MTLPKISSDNWATIFGAIAGVAELLVATGTIKNEEGQLVAGIALILLGIVSNKKTLRSG